MCEKSKIISQFFKEKSKYTKKDLKNKQLQFKLPTFWVKDKILVDKNFKIK